MDAPACLRHTELPHTSRLFSDFLYHRDRVERFYKVEGSDHFPMERRTTLVGALRELNGDSENLRRLAEPDTVAVVTGQQVGLFSGPAYTIYKALTAVRLAELLTAQGRPAVPVFWLATEDHDFAEVNHSWIFDPTHEPIALKVDGQGVPDQAVGGIRIESWPLDELRRILSGFPFGDEISDLVQSTHAPGATMGDAFHDLLKVLLAKHDLLFLDPLQPSVRKLGAPLVQKAIAAGPDLNAKLLQRNKELEAAGYHSQVHVEGKTSLFFLLEDGRRITLKRQNGDYVSKDRRFTPDELSSVADHLSPNALLRPVFQDYILPTASYVGGPAELAYLAQSHVLYETLLGHMPKPVSRSGFTLFDTRTAKLMDRYHLRIQDTFHGDEALHERVARELVPPDLKLQFSQAESGVAQMLDRLDQSLKQFDPTLSSALEKSRAKILYQLSKIEAKTARESLRRSDRAAAEAAFIYNGLFPHKHLQERFYSILPFLAAHGLDLIDTLYENVRLECPDHILLRV